MQTSTHFPSVVSVLLRRLSTATVLLTGLWLTLPAAAQVGIGTTAPDAKAALDIVSTDKGLLVPRLTAVQRGAITTPPAGLLVYQTDGGQPGFWYYEATTGWTHLNPSGADNLGNHTATQSLGLNNNWLSNDGSATGLRLDNAGNVGLGGTPYGGFRLSAELANWRTMLLRDNRPPGHQVGPHQFFVVGPANGAEYAGAILDYIHADTILPHRTNALEVRAAGAASNGRINFYTGVGVSLNKPQLTIRADGSVGIGLSATATPFRPLEVQGGIHASGPIGEFSFADRTVATTRFVWYSQADVARLYTGDFVGNGTNLLGVTRTGLMGLGTLAPKKQLHVYAAKQYGGLRIQVAPGVNTFGSGSLEFWSDPQGNANEWRPGMIRSVDQGNFTGGLAFYINGVGSTHKTDSLEVMRITNRRVGVGTSNPGVALHVRDTTSTTSTTVGYFEGNNAGYAGAYVNAMKASARPFWGYQRQGAIVGWHDVATNGDWNLILKSTVPNNFFIPLTVTDSTGRVGIGTSAPRTRLSITPGTSEPKITLWDGGSLTSHYGFGISAFQLNYHVNAITDNHVFYAGGKNGDGIELMRIKGNGRVGIGTSNPQQNLHIYSGQRDVKLRLQGSNVAGGTYGAAAVEFWSDPQGTVGEWRPGMIRSTDQGVGSYTGGMAFYVNGAGYGARQDSVEVMRLTNNKVGVGTGNPVSKLHVVTDNSLGGNEDDYIFDAYGNNADLGIFMRKSRGTVAAPQNAQFGDRVGMLSFSPRTNNSLGYLSGSDIQAFYMGDGTTPLSDLRFSTSAGQLGLRLTESGNVGVATFTANTRLTISPTTAEPKITLWDGGSTTSHYGFGISGTQLNYHVNATSDNHVFYAGGKNGDGTELLRIKGNGRVGIGTNNPLTALHVVAPSSGLTTVAQFEGSNASFAGTYVNAATAGAAPFYGYQQQGSIKAYHMVSSTGDWQLNVNGGTRLTVDAATGNLGVGTTNPIARLHINGGTSAAPVGSTYSFFNPGNSTLSTNTATTARNVAAYIEGGQFWVNSAIVAGALNTSSDRRIKQVIGVSDSRHDLDLLNQLRITDYRYIDQFNNTPQVVKKVIAQEVEAVLPAAVSRSRMAIPDVYEVAAAVQYAAGTVTVRTTKVHGFRAGDQVRLYDEQQQDMNPTVAVIDAHTFTFAAPEAPAARLFVYGKFVDDFRSVDYDALAMLNVSATQELARQLKALQERNAALEQRAATAEAVTQSFESRLRALEAGTGQVRK